ncbi:Acyl-CoA dehydrogenase/oxidase C-terminal [Acididesulfobacillus acetoxydans]|uniref:Acyl-CoA dehydrogenase n=1 Tax=Acididesulfobacillus acetoxydans TaxID=1561005 RepID=A0A8S0W842_9FIRM|nr:acyl-CoA dehydrogenase family protein [Acididesulfobacillus acetoxydans]CAA7601459.1 Acyl-CoA dehydrogenase/oxidase C-terminal [Acididesulfobacillus acetoxydans]CEJ06114.1 Acyl-CoA dehydrogenase [Acididesulfobacillus acetoxydans]
MFDFLLTDDQKSLQEEAAAFVREKVPRQLILDMDAEKITYPPDYLKALGDANLLGLRFDKPYGGRGLRWQEEVAVLEEVGVLGTSLACLYSLPSIVGEAIAKFGSEHLKERYLKPTLAGKLYTAEALTEPRGGSDFFGATTIARREGQGYILNGQKRFVVGAEGADYFMVYANTDPEGKAHESMSAFIVDRGPGVEVAHVYGLMGTRGGGAGRVVFKNVRVPEENLLGQAGQAAKIFYQMMIPERLTSAAGALGMARAALDVASAYSTKRKAFGRKIKDFEAVSFKVADSLTRLDAARSLVYAAARAIDSGVSPSMARRLVSEAKKFATETTWAVVNDAMQIMGGIGYTNVYPIERLLRDTRLIMIWTGTNEIMDLIIQHEYYKEMAAASAGKRLSENDAENSHLSEEKVFE